MVGAVCLASRASVVVGGMSCSFGKRGQVGMVGRIVACGWSSEVIEWMGGW